MMNTHRQIQKQKRQQKRGSGGQKILLKNIIAKSDKMRNYKTDKMKKENTVIIEGKMGGTYERTVQGGNQEAGRPVRKRTRSVADLAIHCGTGQG